MATCSCSSSDSVLNAAALIKANGNKIDAFTNGTDTQTVQLGSGPETPALRNLVRQMYTTAAQVENASVDGKFVLVNNSTENRTLAARFADIINVKDYGAKGDGSDDTDAINAAVAAGVGKTVWFPAGTYGVTETIELPTDTHLLGSGEQSSQITAKNAGMTVFSSPASGQSSYVSLRGLNIYTAQSDVTGIKIVNSHKWSLEAIGFYGCACAVEVKNGGLHAIDSCSTNPSGSLPAGNVHIWEGTDSDYVAFIRISNFQINAGGGIVSPALHFRRAVAVRCDNIICNNGEYEGIGILLENDCQGCCFTNCIFVALGVAIWMLQGEGIVKYPICNTFTNVDIDQCSQHAVYIQEGFHNIFQGCQITSSGFYTGASAILLKGNYPNYNTITSSHISGYSASGGTGIKMEGTTGIRIIGNDFNGCNVAITTAGTNVDAIVVGNDLNGGHDQNNAGFFGAEFSGRSVIMHNQGGEWTSGVDIRQNEPVCTIKNRAAARGTTTAQHTETTSFVDAGGNPLLNAVVRQNTSGSNELRFVLFRHTATAAGALVNFVYPSSGNPYLSTPELTPGVTGAYNLGSGSARWKQLFATTATIDTSDIREKTNLAVPSEALMRAWGKVNFKVFQFISAVDEKGVDSARLHVGVIAQEVRDAFASEGLDASRYGLFCHDEWEAKPAEYDEDGTLLRPAVEAGDVYGIRYEEALALECAYHRWRLEQIETRLNEFSGNSSVPSGTSPDNL